MPLLFALSSPEGDWKIYTFEVLWEYDEMRASRPEDQLPIDSEVLKSMRPSYRHMAYLQTSRGVKVNQDLHGDDRPEELKAFHAREDEWLAGKA